MIAFIPTARPTGRCFGSRSKTERSRLDEHSRVCRSDRFNLLQNTAHDSTLSDDLRKIHFATDFVLEIELFLRELLFQHSNLPKGKRILHGNSNLICDLGRSPWYGGLHALFGTARCRPACNWIAADIRRIYIRTGFWSSAETKSRTKLRVTRQIVKAEGWFA